MTILKLAAIAVLLYTIGTGKWAMLLLALLLWEIGSGFKASTIFWLSDRNDRDR